MKALLVLVLCLGLVAVMCIMIRMMGDKRRIVQAFERGNVIVYGSKGKGKDLLFQAIINTRNKDYFSNISFGGKYHPFHNSMLELGNNDYRSFIDGKISIVDKANYPFEEKDIYISDGGIILPSQMDSQLHRIYPSFPISYALSRHLWKNNIHINSQALNRVWKALREQADSYIKCLHVIHLPFVLVVECIQYEKYESACNNVLPMKSTLFNQTNKALRNQFVATNGSIEKRYIMIPKRSIKYDTRAYHQIMFGKKFTKPKRKGTKHLQ